MPAPAVPSYRRQATDVSHADREEISRVENEQDAVDAIAELHRVLSGQSERVSHQYPETHVAFDDFLHKENAALEEAGIIPARLGVSFRDLTTWGEGDIHAPVKTLKHALWRTLTGQDIYEWTLGRMFSKQRPENGRALIQNFSGVVRGGEIML
jgi:ATP-binding cassette subfamily G (WHITE) protein 2 (SNQ2)